uniref:Phosphatidylinositol-specific phospholipase C X domain-containing protein n=1 Tax=Odontella aurita TaxID=265563 RepID=A0A7S4J3G8_9STRA|mmetsp:Transcript_37320/g.111790  ORF Transcript_37320/g.111790 Transcript_37320/m.111790 type:complete len:371 (+) Transcript_37320:253-1365(+)
MSSLLCNGFASNCDLRVNEIMFAGVHNAMSSEADGFIAANNLKSLEDALDAGFRVIDLESCDCGDSLGLQLCHRECNLGGYVDIGHRDVGEAFTHIKLFLDDNPGEVVIVSLQVNDDTLGGVHSVVSNIDGLISMLYSHPDPNKEWPTMRELIDSGKRLMIMHHTQSTPCTEPCYEGFITMFNHVFDTPWYLEREDLLDSDQSCVIARGAGSSRAFLVSNHFSGTGPPISLPSLENAIVLNEKSVLENRHEACEEKLGKRPNIIMVDFWSKGDVVAFVEESNRALAPVDPRGTSEPTSAPTDEPTPVPTAIPDTTAPNTPIPINPGKNGDGTQTSTQSTGAGSSYFIAAVAKCLLLAASVALVFESSWLH